MTSAEMMPAAAATCNRPSTRLPRVVAGQEGEGEVGGVEAEAGAGYLSLLLLLLAAVAVAAAAAAAATATTDQEMVSATARKASCVMLGGFAVILKQEVHGEE